MAPFDRYNGVAVQRLSAAVCPFYQFELFDEYVEELHHEFLSIGSQRTIGPITKLGK